MDSKPIYMSKTFWMNVAYIAAVAFQAAIDTDVIPLEYQGGLLAALNIALRFVSSRPVTLRARSKGGLIDNAMGGGK